MIGLNGVVTCGEVHELGPRQEACVPVGYSWWVSGCGCGALLPLLPFMLRVSVKTRDMLLFGSLAINVFYFHGFALLFSVEIVFIPVPSALTLRSTLAS